MNKKVKNNYSSTVEILWEWLWRGRSFTGNSRTGIWGNRYGDRFLKSMFDAVKNRNSRLFRYANNWKGK